MRLTNGTMRYHCSMIDLYDRSVVAGENSSFITSSLAVRTLEKALSSARAIPQNLIEIQRSMTTGSTAIFVPFTTQELFQTGKEALYYGLNALSNNLIMVDRKNLKNPNGLIPGTPGSNKSFSAKREIANAFLVTNDDVIQHAVYQPDGHQRELFGRG